MTTKQQKLPSRHPVNYMWDRYKTFQRLLVMKAPYQIVEIGDNQIPTLVWTLDTGMQIGLYEDVVELMLECGQASFTFSEKLEKMLFEWEKHNVLWKGTDFNSAGIWVSSVEMEFLVNCKVKGMFYKK